MTYPFEKPRRLDVDHAAPLGDQRDAVLALALADDLAVYEHRDQTSQQQNTPQELLNFNLCR
ncbi:hypothetical protein EYF80_006336 [Liparis tanakae]|uniref:Uncharacterized protein n=1 Tax=Liparis tanakae TaxID=230148 RepID=A0A4Z2IZB6_9TELE|nr:hypothetical protein EYF80_006336 [Liparis tanakae]